MSRPKYIIIKKGQDCWIYRNDAMGQYLNAIKNWDYYNRKRLAEYIIASAKFRRRLYKEA